MQLTRLSRNIPKKNPSVKNETHENINGGVDEDEIYDLDKLSLNEKKLCSCLIEGKLKNMNNTKLMNSMNLTQNNKVNIIAECNLLNDIQNTSKLTKHININYSPIIYECMNNHKSREKFENFRILWDSGCGSTIVMRRLIKN